MFTESWCLLRYQLSRGELPSECSATSNGARTAVRSHGISADITVEQMAPELVAKLDTLTAIDARGVYLPGVQRFLLQVAELSGEAGAVVLVVLVVLISPAPPKHGRWRS